MKRQKVKIIRNEDVMKASHPVTRQKYDEQVRVGQIRNIRRAEQENDRDLAKWPIMSKPWISKMRKADRLRTELIELGGVLIG